MLEGTRYRVLQRLGEGGMGEVFEVEHVETGSIRVLKLMRAELSERTDLVDRMRVEAQALAALNHENIVKVTDFGRAHSGAPFLVMERLNGCTLAQELKRSGSFSVSTALTYTRQALAGLAAAHELGIVHRDVKPDNLFVHYPRQGGRIVKLLDFGIAKVLDGARGAPEPPLLPTTEGSVIGTPRYLSPEQAAGRGIDARTDIYAAGLVLYALLTGRGPFDDARRESRIAAAHISRQPDPPSRFASERIPMALDAVVLKALTKDPDHRYQTAREFADALAAIAEQLDPSSGFLRSQSGALAARGAASGLATTDLAHPAPLLQADARGAAGLHWAGALTGPAGRASTSDSGGHSAKQWRLLAFFLVAAVTASLVAMLVARWVATR
jgi:serine/threonine-protein kinase